MTRTNAASISPPIMLPNGRATDYGVSAREIAPPHGTARWGWGHVATTALLVLALAASLVAFGPWRPGWHELSSGHLLAATTVTTPPGREPSVEVLLDATMDGLPTGHAIVEVDQLTLPPGSGVLTMPQMTTGEAMVTVESGEVTATAAGAQTRLVAGETFIPPTRGATVRVTGATEASLFGVMVVGTDAVAVFGIDENQSNEILVASSIDALPGGSGQILLERLSLPPGSTLVQEASPLVWTGIGEGALGLTLTGEHVPFHWESGQERTFRHGQYLPPIQPGTQMTLRNAEDAPLVLYRLRLTPTGGEASAAGTAPSATPAS